MSQAPRFTTRLWSEEVGIADAGNPAPQQPDVYQFSSGRGFKVPADVFSRPWPNDTPVVDTPPPIEVDPAAPDTSANITGTGSIALPMPTLLGSLDDTIVLLPVPTVSAIGLSGNIATASLSLPPLAAGSTGASTGGNTEPPPATGTTTPPVPVPAPIGSTITTVSITNTSGAALVDAPVTFGHPFKEGELTASYLEGVQMDIKARHADGSVRHAILSCRVPSLAAGATLSLPLNPAASAPEGEALTVSSLAGLSAAVSIVQGGLTYTADIAAAAVSGTAWLSGPICAEWVGIAPLVTSSGAEHAQLHARYEVRRYANGRIRVSVIVENTWSRIRSGSGYAWNATQGDQTYDLTITVGGAVVFSRAAVVHYPRTRWRKTFWTGGAEPPLLVAHHRAYLIATKAVPNYDPAITPSATYAAGNRSRLTAGDDGLFGKGVHTWTGMFATGGRHDIGLLPGWAVAHVLAPTVDSAYVNLRQGELSGAWSMHLRDQQTGNVLRLLDWPYASTIGTSGDTTNPATRLSERIPNMVSNTNPLKEDVSHHPDQAFVPYLLTGDHYYLEELQSWAMFCVINQNPHPTARNGANGYLMRDQVRAYAWALRSLAHGGYITPDGHPLKEQLITLTNNNVDWLRSNYLNSAQHVLGYVTINYAVGYSKAQVNSVDYAGQTEKVGVAPWMDDFLTSAVGRCCELGYNALDVLRWKSKFVINRLTAGSAFCWQLGSAYAMAVRDSATGPFYTSMAQIYAFFPSTWRNLPCGSSELATALGVPVNGMVGYPTSPIGYPSIMQPALSYARTYGVPNADSAWLVFDSRTQKVAPNDAANMGAPFAILPRD